MWWSKRYLPKKTLKNMCPKREFPPWQRTITSTAIEPIISAETQVDDKIMKIEGEKWVSELTNNKIGLVV